MGRGHDCKVCEDKRILKINKSIKNTSLAETSRRYGYSLHLLRNHKKYCLGVETPPSAKKNPKDKAVTPKKQVIQQINVSSALDRAFSFTESAERLHRSMEYLDSMIEACNDYLIDPEDPKKYFLGVRSEEVEVVYKNGSFDEDEGRWIGDPVPKKAKLQELINYVDSCENIVISNINIRHDDPRNLLLKTVAEIRRTYEFIFKQIQTDIENQLKRLEIEKSKRELQGADGKEKSAEESLQEIVDRLRPAMGDNSQNEELKKLTGLE